MDKRPTQRNIAIIGAGIMGISHAYALMQAGHDVTLYDPRGFPARNASLIAGGMLAPYSEIEHMPPEWIEAGLKGIALWQEIASDLGGMFDFAQKGSLFVAHKDDEYILERFAAHLSAQEHCTRINGAALHALEPQIAEHFSAALYLEEEAHIYPLEAMTALCDELKTQGATLIQERATAQNLAQNFDWVLDCRGMAAATDEPNLRGVKGEIVIVRNPEFTLQRPVRLMHPRYPLYIVPRADHIFMIGATMIESTDAAHVSLRSAMELMSALYSLHPSFGEAQILELLSDTRPSYSDNLPHIKVRGNVISCNGLFRHGFLLSPFIAKCVTDYISGVKTDETTRFIEE